MRKTIIATTAALALSLGLSACGSNDDSAADPSTPPAVSTETPTEAAPSTPSQGDDDDRQLTGETLKKASAAALKATGEGKVIDSERSDDADHVYEVEVLLDNNEDVTVELDEAYALIRIDR